GQSGWGVAFLDAARALARRGIATLLAEGPGQGRSRLEGGVLLDVDVPAAYGAFVDFVLADPELGGAVGIWGNSMGGLFAALTAAADERVVACCVNGAPARPRLLEFRTFAEQAQAMLGTTDADAVRANFERLSFDSGRQRVRGAMLVLHGGRDPIVGPAEQRPFLDAADPAHATLRVWDDGEHTIYNHSAERTAFVADWFTDRFSTWRQ
ncbi:alpha/beta hydrolase family protein, partial [Nocardia sp. NPDC004582]